MSDDAVVVIEGVKTPIQVIDTITEIVVATTAIEAIQAVTQAVELITVNEGATGSRGIQGERGVPGPAGPLGGYQFFQDSPAATWSFMHEVGRMPVAITYDKLGRRIFPDTVSTTTQVVLTFAFPMAGSVILL